MSRAHAAILIGFLAIIVGVAVGGQRTTGVGGFSELHRVEVADAGDLEVVMGIVEKSGESVSPKHYHPGGEFGFADGPQGGRKLLSAARGMACREHIRRRSLDSRLPSPQEGATHDRCSRLAATVPPNKQP